MQRKESFLDRWFGFLFILYAFVAAVSISATNIVLGLIYITGLTLLWKGIGKERIVFNQEIMILFFVTFSWGAFCTLLSGNYVIPIMFYDMWEYSPIVFFPLFLSATAIRKERAIEVLFLSSSLVSILGILQYFVPTIVYPFPRQLLVDDRFRGFFSHPLHAGGFYSIVAILAFSMILFLEYEGRKKAYLWLVCIINLMSLVLSMSRSYYISVAVIILILSLVKNWRLMIYASILLASLLIVVLSFPNAINSRVKTLTDPNFLSNKERTYIWESAIAMTKEHPLFGVGKGNWGKEAKEKYFPRIEREYNYKLPPFGHAHNSYLTWASETGLIGLALSLSFWCLVGWSLYSKVSGSEKGTLGFAMAIGALGSLGNLFVAGLFENNLGTAVILLLIAMLVGLSLDDPLDTL